MIGKLDEKSLWRRLHLALARTSDKLFREAFASWVSPKPKGALPENILRLPLCLKAHYVHLWGRGKERHC